LTHLTPIRDAAGEIIGLAPRTQDATPRFDQLLAETMTAVGAPSSTPPASTALDGEAAHRSHFGRLELAVVVCGLLVALALIVLINWLTPTHQAQRPVLVPPVPAPPSAQPTLAPTATATPSATPSPPTATVEPPTPQIVYIEVAPPCDPANPPYRVTVDVYDGNRPLGRSTGTSCESLAAAAANADALAAEMRLAHQRGKP
jgi:hypothetical protein